MSYSKNYWLQQMLKENKKAIIIHDLSKCRTQLSNFTFTFHFSCIREGNGTPLQYSCLENPMDGGAW